MVNLDAGELGTEFGFSAYLRKCKWQLKIPFRDNFILELANYKYDIELNQFQHVDHKSRYIKRKKKPL